MKAGGKSEYKMVDDVFTKTKKYLHQLDTLLKNNRDKGKAFVELLTSVKVTFNSTANELRAAVDKFNVA